MEKLEFINQLAKSHLTSNAKKKVHSSHIEMSKMIIDELGRVEGDAARQAYQKSLNQLQKEARSIETKNTVTFKDGKSHKEKEIVTPSINEVSSFIIPLVANHGFSVQVKHAISESNNDIVNVYMEVSHEGGHIEKFKSTAEMELPASLCYAAEVSATVSIVEKGLLKQAFGFAVNSADSNVSLEDKDILGVKLEGFQIAGLDFDKSEKKIDQAEAVELTDDKVTPLQITQIRKNIKNMKLKDDLVRGALKDMFDVDQVEDIVQSQYQEVLKHISTLGNSKASKISEKSTKLKQAQ